MSTIWYTLINPRAGAGRSLQAWQRLQAALQAASIETEVTYSEAPGQLTALAAAALAAGHRHLLCIGGDGTVNEVVNAIAPLTDSASVRLAVFPAGTSTDWARSWDIPRRPADFARLLAAQPHCYQDLGRAQYHVEGEPRTRYFCNVAGLAFDAFVVERLGVSRMGGFWGELIYLRGILQSLWAFDCPRIELQGGDMAFAGAAILCNAGLCRYSGGGMQLVPHALPDDGLLDLTLVEAMRPGEVLRALPLLFNGKLYSHPKAHHARARKATIYAKPLTALEVDGEWLGHTPVVIDLLPRALCVVAQSSRLRV